MDDTITAISTPLGEGGIGIVRLSGKDAVRIAEKLFHSSKNKKLSNISSHKIIHGVIKDPETKETIDEVLVSVMLAPHTYTKENIVEINCHGGMLPLRRVLELALKHGARLAEPGEFTKRAFLNGRIDLSKAEAVLDLIKARTDESGKIALEQLKGRLSEKISDLRERLTDLCVTVETYIDFPDEEIEISTKDEMKEAIKKIIQELESLLKSYDEGRFFREGLAVAIVGRPNVGKSSLLNALLQRNRAIVTEMPGTTRDIIEEYLNINGLPLRVIDTAGIRESHDMAEIEGVKRSLSAIENADLIIAVIDGSHDLKNEDIEVLEKIKDRNTIIAINKSDIMRDENCKKFKGAFSKYQMRIIKISALKDHGIDELKNVIFNSSVKNWNEHKEGIIITNLRHKTLIQAAYDSLKDAVEAFNTDKPVEIIAIGLRDSLDKLGEIIGAVTTDDILNRIFSSFCIGK
ncbi:MAG: tRNA uridine-5-carboxymethylaminomethyl(34) synthesis GTPase MnmE [Nitrospiraceae bacterium]|nr:tRNA uridine-5-carboxymethylaminomethyl(34) synthesis GTPase MnmE [Nitrospiraceae bacterium]